MESKNKKLRLGFLASGRGSNVQAVIDRVSSGHLEAEICVVISDVKDSAALTRARDAGIAAEFIDPGPFKTKLPTDIEQKFVERLQFYKVDLVCLAGYMRIVKAPLLEAFPGKIINIHPSLLPSFPGLDVQRKALDYGVKWSGCTVHFVDAGTDTGPIICQAAVPVLDEDTSDTLAARILNEEHRIYSTAIQMIASGHYRMEGRRVLTSKSEIRKVVPPANNTGSGGKSK